MTRINAGISVEELHDKHLMAEHREIKRIPNCIKKGRYSMKDQPSEFTLGTGHVKFFYDKLLYLKNRYDKLYKECKKRGFNVTYYGCAWEDIPDKFMGDYTPTREAVEMLRKRIKERLSEMKP